MRNFINSFMSNDSAFGRTMTKIGIIICANLMFVLFSMPVVTIGASYVALYHVMLKTLRGNTGLNPFKEFWIGFKSNFKQATIAWIGVLVVAAVLVAEWILVNTQTGAISIFYTIVFYLELLFSALALAYLFPLIARFKTTAKQAAKNSILLSVGYIFSFIKITVAWVAPIALSIIYPIIFLHTWYLWLLVFFGAIIWGTSHTVRYVIGQNEEALKNTEEELAEEERKKEEAERLKEEGREILKQEEAKRLERAAAKAEEESEESEESEI